MGTDTWAKSAPHWGSTAPNEWLRPSLGRLFAKKFGLKGRGHRLYCSQFVVYTFQFVAEQNNIPPARFFNANDARVSPSNLASLLQGNPNFREAGYLMPNQR